MWVTTKLNDESGAALIMAILMLVLLTIIGISALNNTDLELAISGNDKAHKMTYYAADAGNELSKELIERAVENRGWKDVAGTTYTTGDVTIQNKDFWLNPDLPAVETPSVTNMDADLAFARGRTYLRVGANSQLSSGGAVQMAAGYEGVGKGAAGGGAWIIYDVRSRHEGVSNSQSQIKGQWRHVL
jgi:hypothetical protein